MKKVFVFIPALLIFSFTSPNDTISKKEKKFAEKFLKDTENGVFKAVKGLSDAQLKFKPGPDRWSVEECVKHIAITESALWKMTDATIKQAPNPDKRSEIKATDEQVIQKVEDRTTKVKTFDPLKPENTPYKSLDEALDSFKTARARLIDYVKSTNDDLRNHVAVLPIATFDCYQMILFIGAHSNRHTQQIEEVKADPNFPKN
jgi:hypothetical protein